MCILNLTKFDVDLVCGYDDRRILIGCGGWRQACVGWRSISRVAHSLNEVQLATPLHFVTKAINKNPSPGSLIKRGATKQKGRFASGAAQEAFKKTDPVVSSSIALKAPWGQGFIMSPELLCKATGLYR